MGVSSRASPFQEDRLIPWAQALCSHGQHKLRLLFLGLTCCPLSLEWEPYFSRYANTLSQLLSGSSLGSLLKMILHNSGSVS